MQGTYSIVIHIEAVFEGGCAISWTPRNFKFGCLYPIQCAGHSVGFWSVDGNSFLNNTDLDKSI